jgi:anthranilate phosphoribosyltransferase
MELLGVYDEDLVEPLAKVLHNLGVNNAMVVHGLDGLDEISMSAPTSVCEVRHGEFKLYTLNPEKYGFTLSTKEDLQGGTPQENAQITRDILDGQQGPKTDAVLLNSAAALYLGREDLSMSQAVDLARETISSGKARLQLDRFITLTNQPS